MAKENRVEPELNKDVATFNTAANKQIQTNQLYTQIAPEIYSLIDWLIAPDDKESCFQLFCRKFIKSFNSNHFKRYERVLCFRILNEALHGFKPQLHFDLSGDELFCIYLKHKLSFNCSDIAAILGTSDGSVRTKLLRSRLIIYKATPNTDSDSLAKINSNSSHSCILTQEALENGTIDKMSPEQCSACFQVFESIKKTNHVMKEIQNTPLPVKFKDLPQNHLIHFRNTQDTSLNWNSAPWYLKLFAEGVLATALVVGIVISVPKIKSAYEVWIERRVELGSLTELAASVNGDSNAGETMNQGPVDSSTGVPAAINEYGPPELASLNQNKTTVTSEFSERDGNTASSNKIYRIMIKTDAPENIREQVSEILSTASGATQGVELPGGIMFDTSVPLKNYKSVVSALGQLGETKVIITQSRMEIVPGRARLKIWLQRI